MATRRQFSREFKLEAVRLVKERGVALAQAARDLDLHETVLRSWIRELATDPQQMYLTHYGAVGDVPRLAGLLLAQVDAMVAMAQALAPSPQRHDQLKAGLQAIARTQLVQHGLADPDAALQSLVLDIELNAQGLGVWLDRDTR